MREMDYGCGTTVHLEDMEAEQTVLYVGVGGGLEALQFAYFARRPGGVIAIDSVAEMREAARANLDLAADQNDWFDPAFVEIRDGSAFDLPVASDSIDLAAQNCLFNIFKTSELAGGDGDLERALAEMHRVLRPGGRLMMSDPIAPLDLPLHLQEDEQLRAQCISGCLPYETYMQKIVAAGFGTIEVRARQPYRFLSRKRYGLDQDVLLESLELCAFKVPAPDDGACVFTGRVAIYTGEQEAFDDGVGHLLQRDVPLAVCDKTAFALARLIGEDLVVTEPTWHYGGGGCC